jgi:hypothetical protein
LQSHQKVNTKQRYEQEDGLCHSPAETEMVTGISFNNEYSGVCYKERMLQRTVFINKIRMLQRTRRNITGRLNTCVRVTCRTFHI